MPDEGFLRRWSRRKIETRQGQEPEPEPAPPELPAREPALADDAAPYVDADAHASTDASAPTLTHARELDASAPDSGVDKAAAPVPLPTMDDVAALTRDSDYSGFVARGVDQSVRRSALKKLFADPHFNTMDRLDIYIDDYTKPSPVSATMLASLRHAARLFERVAEVAGDADDAVEAIPAPAHAAPIAAAIDSPAEPAPPEPQDQEYVPEHVSDTASTIPPETETR